MKINKHFFIGVLLVLIMIGIVGTASAADSLDTNLTAQNTVDDAVSVDASESGENLITSTDEGLLSDGETTIYVDSNYDGDELGTEDNPYKTIYSAVASANGGETIFIKNGEYTETVIKDIAKSLTFEGESQGGVIINTGSTGFINTYNICNNLVFNNLYFKDIATATSSAVITVGGSSEYNNVYITNCVFDNCSGRYGALNIYAKYGEVIIDNCKFLNTKASNSKYSGAIYFGSAGTNTYTIRNTVINGSTNTVSSTYGAIYINRASAGPTVLDNVTIVDCSFTGANGLISTKGDLNISNSKFINNNVDVGSLESGSLVWIQSGTAIPKVNVETTIIANNTGTNYLIGASGDNAGATLNYNNIQNNTFATKVASSDSYDLDYNYWGSNDEPADVTVNNWAIDNGGEFTLNDGTPLAKEIPRTGDAPIGDENSTFVSTAGDDNNTGSADSPVATIAKAVEIAKTKSGEIFIEEGTYTESNIELDSNVTWSITGVGNVVIDGNASSNSIFILHGGAATITNVRFTNNKARFGGAIMVNYGSGTIRDVADIDLTIDSCTFDNIGDYRGGSIYLWYVAGNFTVIDSKFVNSTCTGWGGAICVGYSTFGDGLNMIITGSTFENCSANNGGACYLSATTIDIANSNFTYNSASYDSAALYVTNSTATIDNCIISHNIGGSQGVAIKATLPGSNKYTYLTTLTITNSVIENNTGRESTLPAIYVDQSTLDVSYSSIVNDLSVETRTAAGYDAIYGQGIATLNNNWWGTNDPTTKVTGTNITMDNWVIMNVEANASEAVIGDKVTLTVDFNHVNTTAGEIEELTGGVIPKTHKVQLSSESGTFVPATFTIKDGAVKSSTYTVGDINDIVSVSSEEALVEMSFAPEIPPYYGVIYVSKDGDDNNNGSEDYPVATIAKAIELASVVGGSGQIIVNEGTYNGTDYLVTKNLTITGVGDAILDAEGKGRLFYLPSSYSFDKFELNGLTLANSAANSDAPSGYYGTVIYNYAAIEVVLNNVSIIDNDGGASTLISTNGYALIINNSAVRDNAAGKLIAASGRYDSLEKSVIIINTTFENNAAPDYRIIEAGTSFGSMTLNLTDSHFISNSGKLGIVQADSKTTVNVVGTEFVSNANNLSSGGAIDAYTLNVVNSSFIDNKAARSGGAIYINRNGNAVITKSSFVNNIAGEKGSAIYNNNELTINYCVLLTDSAGCIIYHDGGENVMDATYNWWGSNDDPSSLIGVGTYEDDWGDDADCEFDASKWVIMTVNNNLTAEPLEIGDQVEFTVDFNQYTDSTGTSYELTDSIPEVEVTASAIKGVFDNDKTTTENGVATFIYTADIGGEDTATITSDNAVDTTIININEPVILEVIYVGPDGDDSNIGSYDSPVATIAHAIDIAEYGKIVIFEGNYTIDATLVINKDFDIRGEGTAIIDGNLTRIIENTANLNLTNLIFTNGKSTFGAAIVDDGNVTIDGCTFYNNTATGSSGNIINNKKGTMTVNDSKFYGNVANKNGVIASQSGTNLIVNNSEFYDNTMLNSNGVICSNSADTIVENTVFRNNKAKNGGAIWATRATSATTGSLEVTNCTFENNVANVGTGGAIFASGKVTVDVYDSTFINNTAVKSDLGVGGNGGAIYSTGTSDVTVTNSVFIDNAGIEDAGIYASGNSFTISNSVILAKDGDANPALNGAGATVTANDNFWGDNTKANTNANVNRWVIMSAAYDEATGDLTVSFDKTNSTDGTIADYGDVLPDGFNVTVSSSSGALDETLPVVAGQASTTYIPAASDDIIVKSGSAEVIIPIVIEPKVIYVAENGDDNNAGSKDDPVATIAHAIEIAEGRIVIMEGTYTTGDLGIISDDLNITGNGTVIIDAQKANRILYVGSDANVVLENLIMINGAGVSGALLGNANDLTLINCTLANSSAGENNGGAIYNVGKLTIINSTIANNTAKLGGAIFNDYSANGAELIIINSTFENNAADGNGNNGGGAIFAQRIAGLTVTNATFKGNEALTTSSGGAICIILSDGEFTIDDSKFIENHANGQEGTGGGAIYIANNDERKGKLSISNSLFEENTADANGAAIYARATTVNVSNSVIFANKDPAGFSVYGYKNSVSTPAITLNDNWWGTNDDPNDYVGGNDGYKPTISRWVILTVTNDTPIAEGNNVKITASLDKYTDGETIGDLANPITIPRIVSVVTTFDCYDYEMENGEFATYYLVPEELDYLSVIVDTQEIILLEPKVETSLTVEDITAATGSTALINVTVTADDGSIINTGAVTVYFGDSIVATIPVVDGAAVQEVVVNNGFGIYEIYAEYEDDSGKYEWCDGEATLNVTKLDLVLTIPDIAIYNSTNMLVATLKDTDGNPVSDFKVKLVAGELSRIGRTDANGEISMDVSSLEPGRYTVGARSQITDAYNEAKVYAVGYVKEGKVDATLTIPDVVVIGDTTGAAVVATLKDEFDNILSGVKVKVVVGNLSKIAKTNKNGQVSIDISSLEPGEYKISSRSAVTDIFNEAKAKAKAIISEDKLDTTLTVPDVFTVYNSTQGFAVATLKDAYGNAVSGVKVNLTVGNLSSVVETDVNGQVSLDISSLETGEYEISAVSEETDLYKGATADLAVAVVSADKITPTMTIPDVEIQQGAEGAVAVATLTDENGNVITGLKVKIVVGTLSKIARTDANGQVSLDISSLEPGEYKISARSAITDVFNEAKAKAKATIS